MDRTLEALFSSALARNASPGSDPSPEKFTLALLSLEILGLARSVLHNDGTQSWVATDELEWLVSRDYVALPTAGNPAISLGIACSSIEPVSAS